MREVDRLTQTDVGDWLGQEINRRIREERSWDLCHPKHTLTVGQVVDVVIPRSRLHAYDEALRGGESRWQGYCIAINAFLDADVGRVVTIWGIARERGNADLRNVQGGMQSRIAREVYPKRITRGKLSGSVQAISVDDGRDFIGAPSEVTVGEVAPTEVGGLANHGPAAKKEKNSA